MYYLIYLTVALLTFKGLYHLAKWIFRKIVKSDKYIKQERELFYEEPYKY